MRTASLLTIEDDPTLRRLLVQYLQDMGHYVLQAGSGEAGLDVFRQQRPDCVLLDMRLPGMDGMQVLRTMAREAPNMPVIVVSGAGSLKQAVESLREGAWDYLLKPIEDLDDLARAVERALERAQSRKESLQLRQRLEAEVQERTRELQAEIEERKRAEANLRAAKEVAEAANAAKSQFLANMSHELRTPLNAIIGMAQMLYKTHPDDEQKHFLGLILDSSNDLLDIISNLLDLSTIQADRLALRQRPFVLRDSLHPLLETVHRQAEAKGLLFETTVDEDVPQEVVADAFRLKQVLLNVLDNAIKFTERGEIRSRISVLPENGAPPGDSLLLLCQVSDTGIGIRDDKLESIFESFSLGENYLTKKYGGSGLGLAITRELVRMMGGDIWVESLPGQGSSFYFTVRVGAPDETTDASDHHPQTQTADKAAGPGLRILLVEDEPVSRIFTRRMLHIAGHDVLLAEDGPKSLQVLASEPVDLVLMDLQLPGLNGIEATRRIRGGTVRGVDPNIPIVALTAYMQQDDRGHDPEPRFDAYLVKPVEADALLETIEAVMAAKEEGSGTFAQAP